MLLLLTFNTKKQYLLNLKALQKLFKSAPCTYFALCVSLYLMLSFSLPSRLFSSSNFDTVLKYTSYKDTCICILTPSTEHHQQTAIIKKSSDIMASCVSNNPHLFSSTTSDRASYNLFSVELKDS